MEGTMLSSKGKALLILLVGGAAMRHGALSPKYTVGHTERIHVGEEGPLPFAGPPCHAQLRPPVHE